jgi:hypothetical protein
MMHRFLALATFADDPAAARAYDQWSDKEKSSGAVAARGCLV